MTLSSAAAEKNAAVLEGQPYIQEERTVAFPPPRTAYAYYERQYRKAAQTGIQAVQDEEGLSAASAYRFLQSFLITHNNAPL